MNSFLIHLVQSDSSLLGRLKDIILEPLLNHIENLVLFVVSKVHFCDLLFFLKVLLDSCLQSADESTVSLHALLAQSPLNVIVFVMEHLGRL
jgi:hypothetical protein